MGPSSLSNYAERYMVHQPGIQRAIEHYTHPKRVAWLSMCATDEGVLKGEQWCRKCIWRNLLRNGSGPSKRWRRFQTEIRQSVDRTNQSLGQQFQRGGATLYSDASIINCGVNIFYRIVIGAQYFWKKRYLDGNPGNSVLCQHQCSENR